PRWGITGFCGESAAFKHILAEVQQVQDANINVLICGESGTGKELVARAVHFGGQRGKRPFLPVNCGAIPGELMESMLFGHKRGAFTGATEDHPGYFALADGGTLFLDEIGDMPVPLQARLLRVLEDDYVMPLGSTQPRRVDVRVIAATHADLQQALSSGAFRRDLYFRLAGFVVEVPPLRQRREDIPLLLDHFCALFAAEMSMAASGFSAEALALLQDYSYPGNVRELKNLVEYALLKSGGRIIEPSHLNFLDLPPLPRERGKRENRSPEAVAGTASEEERIIEYIRQHGHITNSACRTLLAADSNHASYLLTRLWREGLLSKEGSKRWTCYRLCQPAEE
ncbi:MAG: sigma-54-dependent Fis family transcriptional regulator, partial [Gemmatimonadetes bacterium]|nr:sigma-54-dependent Fis family transcriptional regulator [Gemmatimonadota bacterium]